MEVVRPDHERLVGHIGEQGTAEVGIEGGDIIAETVYYDFAQSPVPSRCANMN